MDRCVTLDEQGQFFSVCVYFVRKILSALSGRNKSTDNKFAPLGHAKQTQSKNCRRKGWKQTDRSMVYRKTKNKDKNASLYLNH